MAIKLAVSLEAMSRHVGHDYPGLWGFTYYLLMLGI